MLYTGFVGCVLVHTAEAIRGRVGLPTSPGTFKRTSVCIIVSRRTILGLTSVKYVHSWWHPIVCEGSSLGPVVTVMFYMIVIKSTKSCCKVYGAQHLRSHVSELSMTLDQLILPSVRWLGLSEQTSDGVRGGAHGCDGRSCVW
ncbi:hypothetical protein EDC04DRAFT_787341 [Pisolithus marmoratus]|nr:hypothetical protein EDC04DRAFT_787341 [Pisolithus marmoratus]